MINAEIVGFVKRQLQAGVSAEKIRTDLLANDWNDADINEAMAAARPTIVPPVVPVAPVPPVVAPSMPVTAPVIQPVTTFTPRVAPVIPPAATAAPSMAAPVTSAPPVTSPTMTIPPMATPATPASRVMPVVPPPNISRAGQLTFKPKTSKVVPVVITLAIMLLLVGGAFFAYRLYQDGKAQRLADEEAARIHELELARQAGNDDPGTIQGLQPPADSMATTSNQSVASGDLWSIFDKSNLALKNKDAASWNIYSYSQIPIGNPATAEQIQFEKVAPMMYELGANIDKTLYVNQFRDEKQAIFSTNPRTMDDNEYYKYTQGSVSFVKIDGAWKLLSFRPNRGWSVLKSGTNKSPLQVEEDLQAVILDSDNDGLTNREELCTDDQSLSNPAKCVKTDPNKNDTDGDGWWDGIQAAMK